MALKCLTTNVPIGERCQPENPFAQILSIFLCKPGVQFDTAADLASEAAWNTKIIAEDIIPIHGIKEVEDQTTDDLIYQSPTGEKTKNGDGIRGYSVKMNLDLKTHQILRTYSGKNWGVITVDRNKNIMGTSVDGTIIKPFKTQYFEVGMQKMAVGSDTPAFTTIELQMADAQELDSFGVYVYNPTFLPSQLYGVGRVVCTQVGTISANAYVVDVAYVDDTKLDGQNTGADTSAAISGALAANFSSKDGAGATVVILTAVEDSLVLGRYTITHTTYTAGTCTFIASTTLKFASEALTLA